MHWFSFLLYVKEITLYINKIEPNDRFSFRRLKLSSIGCRQILKILNLNMSRDCSLYVKHCTFIGHLVCVCFLKRPRVSSFWNKSVGPTGSRVRITVKRDKKDGYSSPWWRQQASLKRRYISTKQHGAAYQKRVVFIGAAVRSWSHLIYFHSRSSYDTFCIFCHTDAA
jgi:hypothetical protein